MIGVIIWRDNFWGLELAVSYFSGCFSQYLLTNVHFLIKELGLGKNINIHLKAVKDANIYAY